MIAIVILVPLLVFIFAGIAVNSPNWSVYRKVYNTLPNRKYDFLLDIIITTGRDNDVLNGFAYFKDGDIKLQRGVYLFNSPVTCLDPYSLYWRIKYMKWIKANLINRRNPTLFVN